MNTQKGVVLFHSKIYYLATPINSIPPSLFTLVLDCFILCYSVPVSITIYSTNQIADPTSNSFYGLSDFFS